MLAIANRYSVHWCSQFNVGNMYLVTAARMATHHRKYNTWHHCHRQM